MENGNKILGKTFSMLFLGLLVSAVTVLIIYYTGFIDILITNNVIFFFVLLQLIFAKNFINDFEKCSARSVKIIYFIYVILNSFNLSCIFLMFDLYSILNLFIISSLTFIVLSIIGYKSNKNLTLSSPYITSFLISGLILSFINLLFFKYTLMDLLVDWFILIIFAVVTIKDIKYLKKLSENPELESDKIHIYLAMQIYLDFINIFIRVLKIFGKKEK